MTRLCHETWLAGLPKVNGGVNGKIVERNVELSSKEQIPSGNHVYSLLWKMAIEMVYLSIEN